MSRSAASRACSAPIRRSPWGPLALAAAIVSLVSLGTVKVAEATAPTSGYDERALGFIAWDTFLIATVTAFVLGLVALTREHLAGTSADEALAGTALAWSVIAALITIAAG